MYALRTRVAVEPWNRGNVATLANIRPSFGLEVLFGSIVGNCTASSILYVPTNAYGSGNCRVHVPSPDLHNVEAIANSHYPAWNSHWSPIGLWYHRGSLWVNPAALCRRSGWFIRFGVSPFCLKTLLKLKVTFALDYDHILAWEWGGRGCSSCTPALHLLGQWSHWI